jgi:hypothetical protein
MRFLVRSLSVVLMSCLTLVPAVHAEDDDQALARLHGEIVQVVGDARCGNVSFCRILPMGYDACGNPTSWIAFNNAPDIKEILETKASEVTFVEEDRMRGKPKLAHCQPAKAPRLACINGRCVLGDLSY